MSSGILAWGVQGNILNSLKINDKISHCCPITPLIADPVWKLVLALLDDRKL